MTFDDMPDTLTTSKGFHFLNVLKERCNELGKIYLSIIRSLAPAENYIINMS